MCVPIDVLSTLFICATLICFIIGNAEWDITSKAVSLTSPSEEKCKEVMTRLINSPQKILWRIILNKSSPNSLLIVLSGINECLVRGLDIYDTRLDSRSAFELSRVLTYTKTLEYLHLHSSPLSNNLRIITNAMSVNTTLKTFELTGDDTITDQDMAYICELITVNTTLKWLSINKCPNITALGEQQISKVFNENKTLKYININDNYLHIK